MPRQAAGLDPVPWQGALAEVCRRLTGAGVDWWLTGSAALAVRGIPLTPGDLDLVVSDEDARRVGDLLLDGLIIVGLGLGLVFAPTQNAAVSGVEHRDAGVASAMVNTVQQIGGSAGPGSRPAKVDMRGAESVDLPVRARWSQPVELSPGLLERLLQPHVLTPELGAQFVDAPDPAGGRRWVRPLRLRSRGLERHDRRQRAAVLGDHCGLLGQAGEPGELHEACASLHQRQLQAWMRQRGGGFSHTPMMPAPSDTFHRDRGRRGRVQRRSGRRCGGTVR